MVVLDEQAGASMKSKTEKRGDKQQRRSQPARYMIAG